jgi:AcrR family transcriptional regulator
VAATNTSKRTRTDRTNVVAEQATRQIVIDAAVASILERGFYRASSNEIARRAGVTWGVIQHHFGTREALMVAVLQDGARHFSETIANGKIDGTTTAERLQQLIELLGEHYGSPAYVAYMQIMLNLDHDPATSAEVRATMSATAARSTEQLRSLIRHTLGPASSTPDLTGTVFHTLKGLFVSQQLVAGTAYDAVVPESDRVARQGRLLAELLAQGIDASAPAPRGQTGKRA